MPDLKISQLPVATTPLAGTELVPIVQGGVTDRTTVAAFLSAGLPVSATTLSASGAVTLSGGTANGVLFLDGSKVATSGSALTFDGTKFYVNTPVLQGSTNNYGGYAFQAGNQNGLAIRNAGDTALSAWFAAGNSAGLAGAGDYAVMSGQSGAIFGIGSSEQMRLTSTGLGIGTTPTVRLHTFSGTAMTQLTVDGTGAIKTGVNFANGGTTYGQIYFDNNSPYDLSVVQQYVTGSLIFGTNSTERARITSAGDLITNVNGTAPSLSTNSTMSFELTSNTSLKIVVRGTDGVTRSVSLTLA